MMAEHARYTDFFLCILCARAGKSFVKNFFIKKITIIVGKPLYSGAVLVQSSLVGRSSGNMQTPIPTVRLRTKVDKYHAESA